MPSNTSGHFPLTHYERTKKFKDSNYGTTTTRISGDTQVPFGHCSLSLAPILDESQSNTHQKTDANDDTSTTTTIAMVSPSGHLYSKQAIYEYLLTKTAEYKEQLALYEQQQKPTDDPVEASRKRQRQEFEQAQSLVAPVPAKPKNAKSIESNNNHNTLQRTSYWLPDQQPEAVPIQHKPPERPSSPYSGQPLKRTQLRPVQLVRRNNHPEVLCAISEKPIRHQPTLAYWTTKPPPKGSSSGGGHHQQDHPGVVVLKQVFDMTIQTNKQKKGKNKLLCPLTNQKIKHTLELKSGGSGFAAHNAVQVKTYKPTIT